MPGTSQSGGRNRKSKRQHALEGTGRKDRGTKAAAGAPPGPDPPAGSPRTPSWLTGFARVEWDRMVVRLTAVNTLSTVDDAALYQYCCLFAETEAIMVAHLANVKLVVKLQAVIAKLRDGEQIVRAIEHIVQLKKIEIKTTQQLRQGHMALRQYLVEFGMTPAARGRVKAADAPPEADPFAEFDPPTGAQH